MSDRDKKILTFMVPLLVLAAFWFLVLAPKREEATTASTALTAEQDRLEAARMAASAADNAEEGFETSYATVVRLGKAIPATVDMPSLLVQLESAAAGTGIDFNAITVGERTTTEAPAEAAPAEGGDAAATPASDAGGTPAQTAPGSAVESANEAQQTADADAAAAEQSGVDTTTSTPASDGGGLPVGGGEAAPGTDAAEAPAPAGLESVPLTMSFEGNFFNLADFFHRVKRFVRVANANVLVSGRLLTIESVNWTSNPETFPRLQAEVAATIYLSPLAQGVTAGATPGGPAPGTPDSPTTPAESTPTAAAPTATATP